MGPLPMLYSLQASTGATILAHLIASTSTMGWPTNGLVWRALICRNIYRQKRSRTRLRQRYRSLVIEESRTRRIPLQIGRQKDR